MCDMYTKLKSNVIRSLLPPIALSILVIVLTKSALAYIVILWARTEMKLHHIASSLSRAANLWLQELPMQHCIASSLKISQDCARLVSSNRD